jgi:FkbM family methyltransferase
VPYLKADPARVEKWKQRLAEIKGLKIGIAWQGSRVNIGDRRRSFPVKALAPLAKLRGVQFISLQKGYGSEQLDALTEFDVLSLGDDFDSGGGAFLDTAAVMQNLDLVISADTSICHVAGALGVPTWLALAYVPDWRWTLQGDRTPWYPTMRLFRQSGFGEWSGVFERMAQALKAEHPELVLKQPAEYRVAASGFNRLARTRHGLMAYHRHDAYTGKSLDELGEVLEGELEVFRQLLRPGMTVLEVGANIGAHTVPLSRLVGPEGVIHALEPQRIVFQALCANLALNSISNVRCRQVAAGEQPGTILVPKLNFDQPNNFAGLSLGDFQEGETVKLVTLDSLNLPRCDFLKVQTAGMELPVIRGAVQTLRKFRPLLYVENNRQDRSAALIEALLALDYKLFWHLPMYYSTANYYGNPQNPFGRLVAANMLGIHASLATNIQGMRPITSPHSDWRKS